MFGKPMRVKTNKTIKVLSRTAAADMNKLNFEYSERCAEGKTYKYDIYINTLEIMTFFNIIFYSFKFM